METVDSDTQQIVEVIKLYFTATYEGNAEQLQSIFHQDAYISGSINGQFYNWTCLDFIARVSSQPTSAEKGEKYDKEILFVDKCNDAAVVKARAAVGDLVFIDYITVLKINGKWLIRNKSFTHNNV